MQSLPVADKKAGIHNRIRAFMKAAILLVSMSYLFCATAIQYVQSKRALLCFIFFMLRAKHICSKCTASSLFYLYTQVVLICRWEVLRRVQCVMICEICCLLVKFYCLVKENNTFWSNDKKT